jgi:hypothetical protein
MVKEPIKCLKENSAKMLILHENDLNTKRELTLTKIWKMIITDKVWMFTSFKIKIQIR